jgi:MoaA/NifB/PqqE/SkfB family radical SAM enzyme
MPDLKHKLRRRLRAAGRTIREIKLVAKGLLSTDHPIQVHIIPMRRCNLSCAYCNEYDDVSEPVPLEEMYRRVDKLAELGATLITISGGETLLHPQLDDIIYRIHKHGILSGLITNGYLLVPKRIRQLNDAGLDHLQISIDNVMPDEVSKKSLKVLDKKLQLLREHADFHVNINSVIGAGVKDQRDAVTIGRRAVELGFSSTVGIIHDGTGQLKPMDDVAQSVFAEMKKLGKKNYARLNRFQDNIALGQPNDWRCRAGARYIYICEDGLVHYCSQQRGYPGIPLAEYSVNDIRREFLSRKSCAPNCTISCVHQTSFVDFWRAPQKYASHQVFRAPVKTPQPELVQIRAAETVSAD